MNYYYYLHFVGVLSSENSADLVVFHLVVVACKTKTIIMIIKRYIYYMYKSPDPIGI